MVPVVIIAHYIEVAEVKEWLNHIQTRRGLYDVTPLVIEWMEVGAQ